MKKLLIDVPSLTESGVALNEIQCEYLFHRKNQGQLSLLEVAEFASYCRQCEDAFCVSACPNDALERQDSGVVKRYNMQCVGCKSCALACPFGTIFPEVMNYITSKCDFCLNQLQDNPEYSPTCVQTAPDNSFQMVEMQEENPEDHIYFSGEHLAILNPSWRHKEGKV